MIEKCDAVLLALKEWSGFNQAIPSEILSKLHPEESLTIFCFLWLKSAKGCDSLSLNVA